MKLLTIGDSVSQGFMSLAAARTDLSFSTLLARKLGLGPADYRYPDWPAEGIPLNIEAILRRLNRRYGSDISRLEWFTVLQTVNDVVDEAEDYYERGAGSADQRYPGEVTFFHNLAVTGFTVADAWLVTPAVCKQGLSAAPRSSEGFLTGPDNAGYRAALKVLNPSLAPAFDECSQLEWVRRHATTEGVENLVLWLGANNALGTVISLKINQTPPLLDPWPHQRSYEDRQRRGWNLWHPAYFRAEYHELLRQVDQIMRRNTAPTWKVFVATVPLVTIAPLAKGVGDTVTLSIQGERYTYYKYYTYFPFEEDFARTTSTYLTMQEALHIDRCIREYNTIIKAEVEALNAQHGEPKRYHIVDIADALDRIAYKRNLGQPRYTFPSHFDFLHPMVNTKYYHADQDGKLVQGGLFSLDGVHPSGIAHGILAFEFLKEMQQAGVVADVELDWDQIFANDMLYSRPITIMQELYKKDELAKHVIHLIRLIEAARGITA